MSSRPPDAKVRNGVRWRPFVGHLPPTVVEVVESRDVPTIEGVCDIIKDNSVRTVARLVCRSAEPESADVVGKGDLFLKRYKRRGWKDLLKSLVLPPKAYREARMANALLACGIPTARPIAAAEKRRWGLLCDSYLITESLLNTVSLRELGLRGLQCPHARPEASHETGAVPGLKEKKALLKALASLMRKLNENRFFHRDFHAGNVLARKGERCEYSVYLMDLHSVRRLWWMSPRRETNALAQLSYTHDFRNVTTTDRVRFLKYYNPRLSRDEIREWVSSINRMTLKLRLRRAKRRTKRCLKNNSRFEVKRIDNGQLYLVRGVSEDSILNAIEAHKGAVERLTGSESADSNPSRSQNAVQDKPPPAHEPRIVKQTSQGVVSLVSTAPEQSPHPAAPKAPEPYCIKHYRDVGLLSSLKNLFRRSQAKRSWLAANGLKVRDVPAAEPIALVEERRGFLGLTRDSFLVMKAITARAPWPTAPAPMDSSSANDDQWGNDVGTNVPAAYLSPAPQIDDYVKKLFGDVSVLAKSSRARAEKKAFIKEFAKALRALHDKGIYHRDTKASNILVTELGNAKHRFSLVDLDGVEFDKAVSARRRRKNLAQMNSAMPRCVTMTDRLRFFRAYARESSISGEKVFSDEKRAIRQIIKATAKRSCVWER